MERGVSREDLDEVEEELEEIQRVSPEPVGEFEGDDQLDAPGLTARRLAPERPERSLHGGASTRRNQANPIAGPATDVLVHQVGDRITEVIERSMSQLVDALQRSGLASRPIRHPRMQGHPMAQRPELDDEAEHQDYDPEITFPHYERGSRNRRREGHSVAQPGEESAGPLFSEHEARSASPSSGTPSQSGFSHSAEVRRFLTRSAPVFDPEKSEVETFMTAMDCTLAVMGDLDPREESMILIRSLGERAQESVFAAGLDHSTPPQMLRNFLLDRFGAGRNKEAAADSLETAVRGSQESIYRFADRIALLARRAEATHSSTIRAFLRGASCAEFVRVIESQSLARGERDALTLAILCEKFEAGRARGLWPEFPASAAARLANVCEVATMQPAQHSSEFQQMPPRQEYTNEPSEPVRCHRCQQLGHIARVCRAPDPVPSSRGNGGRWRGSTAPRQQ